MGKIATALATIFGSFFSIGKLLLSYVIIRIGFALALSTWLTVEVRDLLDKVIKNLDTGIYFSCFLLRYAKELLVPIVMGFVSVAFLRWLIKIIV